MSSVYPSFGGTSVQRCLRCGTPLPTNGVTCANCGAYNPVVQPAATNQGQAQWGDAQSQSSMNGWQYSGAQNGQSFISPPQYSQWAQPSVSSQQNFSSSSNGPLSSSNYPSYPIPGQVAQNNFNGFYATPQQNVSYSYPATGYGSFTQPSPRKKKKPGVGFIVGIGLLIVLLIGGGFTGYYFIEHHVKNNTSTDSTTSKLITPSTTPLFSDTFTSNSLGWDLTSYQGKFFVKVGGGSLVLEDDQNKLLWEIVPNKNFSDFQLDVNATLTKGDASNGYGVFIRASNQSGDLGTYYRFELYGDGTYAIFKGSLDSSGTPHSDLVHYDANSAIAKVGRVNHITIVAKGSAMTLNVNGQAVYSYTDDNYKGGSIALFVSNLPKLASGAQATFTNLAIYPVSQ